MWSGEMWWWRAGGCPKEAVTACQVSTRAGFWQDLLMCGELSQDLSQFTGRSCDPVGSRTGVFCSWRTAPHGKDPHREQFVKSCSLWERLGEVHGGLSSVGVTSQWSRVSVRNPPCEEEGVTEWDELTIMTIRCPTALLMGRRWKIQEWS